MVSLSAAGRRLALRVAPQVEQAYADIESRFGADRLAQLLALLDELVDASSRTRSPTLEGRAAS